MEGYFVRLNEHPGYKELVCSLVDNADYEKVFAIYHKGGKGENPHFHVTIKTLVKQQALRVRLRNIFVKGEGNKHMSLKQWDGALQANSYMFHEDGAPIICNKGYTDEDIEVMRKTNDKVQKEIEKCKQKASWRLEEVVVKRVLASNLGGISQREIARMILQEAFQSDKYQPNDFQLKAMADRVRYITSKSEEDKDATIHSILERIKWE